MGLMDDMFSASMMPGAVGNSAMKALQPLRAMSYISRDSRIGQPSRMSQPRQSRGRNPLMGGDDSSPWATLSQTADGRAAGERMLSPYGLHPLDPANASPNAFLPNSGFFGAHPRLAGGLEGALFGAANTQGANTWGEGISNVAQGLLGGHAQRQAMINRQYDAPYEAAGAMEKLRGLGIEDTLHDAMIQHYRASTEALKNKPDPEHHVTPLPGTDSGIYVDGEFKPNPFYEPRAAAAGRIPASHLPVFEELGIDPSKATPKDWKKVNSIVQQRAVAQAGSRAAAGQSARDNVRFNDDTLDTNTDKRTAKKEDKVAAARTKTLSDKKPSFWLLQHIDPNDSAAKNKWFDDNVGKYINEDSPMPQADSSPKGNWNAVKGIYE